MHKSRHTFIRPSARFLSTAVPATAFLAWLAAYPLIAAQHSMPMKVRGVVAGSYFTPPDGATPSTTVASYYQNATVCADLNDNGACDRGEASATTDRHGEFVLDSPRTGPIIAEILSTSTNTAGDTDDDHKGRNNRRGRDKDHDRDKKGKDKDHGRPEPSIVAVFRASADQIVDGASGHGDTHGNDSHGRPGDDDRRGHQDGPLSSEIAVTPISTELVRMMDADKLDYQTAKRKLATRLDVAASQLLADPGTVFNDTTKTALLTESVILTDRFTLAAAMVSRHDVSPAALATHPHATHPAITMSEAQQVAMNLETIPRYDHVFIIVLENKATSSIKNSPFAPKINAYLNGGNQFTSYFASGNPSEPNRLAISSADDFGITDDSSWSCVPAGDTEDLPEDPLPVGLSPCTNATNHNIKNRPNMFSAMTGAGMTWRVYSESMNPGRDWRMSGAADPTLLAADHVYPAGSPVGALGNPNLMLRFPSGLYATKHNGSVAFQDVRSSAEFFPSNRTMGGGQWDDAIRQSPNTPAGWNIDQLGADLWSGDIGNLNYLEPDQCDDMHGVTVTGPIAGTTTTGTASDCGGSGAIYRGDNYTDYLIKKIQASPVWTNPEKRVAIVISFDEGTATTGFNSCCGWNPAGKPTSGGGQSLGVLVNHADGTVSIDPVSRYEQGNKGHGTSVFGVLTNQADAPKGVTDSDAYSHFSFVRTLQDMFGLADPGDDWSYMNRSKYTASFIAANLPLLPEYAGSADPHFDAVRPMNHAFVIPGDYTQKSGFVTPPGPQVGPDADQRNPWALR